MIAESLVDLFKIIVYMSLFYIVFFTIKYGIYNPIARAVNRHKF